MGLDPRRGEDDQQADRQQDQSDRGDPTGKVERAAERPRAEEERDGGQEIDPQDADETRGRDSRPRTSSDRFFRRGGGYTTGRRARVAACFASAIHSRYSRWWLGLKARKVAAASGLSRSARLRAGCIGIAFRGRVFSRGAFTPSSLRRMALRM